MHTLVILITVISLEVKTLCMRMNKMTMIGDYGLLPSQEDRWATWAS